MDKVYWGRCLFYESLLSIFFDISSYVFFLFVLRNLLVLEGYETDIREKHLMLVTHVKWRSGQVSRQNLRNYHETRSYTVVGCSKYFLKGYPMDLNKILRKP